MNRRQLWAFIVAFAILSGAVAELRSQAARKDPVALWAFDDRVTTRTALDAASGVQDAIEGHFKFVPGISGAGLRFDGYTTRIIRKGNQAPRLGEAFTMEAWVAPAALPWNWCPVLSQENDGLVGYSFGIGPQGEFGLRVSVRGEWKECLSRARVPTRKWSHIAAVFDSRSGIALFLDGREAGSLAFQGNPAYASGADLLIGMNPDKRKPSHIVGPGVGTLESWYAFDGIMDEVRIFIRALSPDELKRSHEAVPPALAPDLALPGLPSGPPGPGRFGAYYTKLRYDDGWDALWPVGPAADIVVQFDDSPVRVVFWRGTRYGPAWVMENGQWLADQSFETWDATEGCYEHMEDPRCLYSQVRILESTEARIVVHWRYAPVSSRDHFWRVDEKSGWGLWVDEYYYFYPDLTAVRKVVWPTEFLGPESPSEIQETIPFCQPGQGPEDVLNPDALTLLNLKGESQVYSWPGEINDPDLRRKLRPENPNIQVVNLKSKTKPFILFEPGCQMNVYVGRVRAGVSNFPAYNHFPVSLLPSDGRYAVAADRVTSFSISYTDPPRHAGPEDTTWASWVYGVTEGPYGGLATLGRSWTQAPALSVQGPGLRSEGYDLSQRAYVLACPQPGRPAVAVCELQAATERPAVNIVLYIRGWGDGSAAVTVDGQPVERGPALKLGYVRTIDGTDLVIWIKKESVRPVRIGLGPR
ncbi:MAG: LamG domain-containing protein [Candidatus Aminicenantales bacterium]